LTHAKPAVQAFAQLPQCSGVVRGTQPVPQSARSFGQLGPPAVPLAPAWELPALPPLIVPPLALPPGNNLALEVSGSFETTNGTMLREAAIAGMGLAILPRFMIADALKTGALDAFVPRPFGVYAVRSGRRIAPKLVSELVRSLEMAFRGSVWSERG
jgi:DNA-binding transcriptional LysR family regulator